MENGVTDGPSGRGTTVYRALYKSELGGPDEAGEVEGGLASQRTL